MNHICRIIIIDDDRESVDLIDQLLVDQGYQIHNVTTGRDALDALEQQDFNIALINVILSDMDGTRLVKSMKLLKPDMYFIMLTGMNTIDRAISVLNSWASAYLIKPFNIEEVSAVIDQVRQLELLKKEKEIAENERMKTDDRYNAVISSLPFGLLQISSDGSIQLANREAQRILGLPNDAVSTHYMNLWQDHVIRQDGSPCPVEELPGSRCLLTGEEQPPEKLGVVSPEGKTLWAIWTAIPLFNHMKEGPTGVVITLREITDQYGVEQTVNEQNQLLRTILDSLNHPFFIVDAGNYNLIIANQAAGISKTGTNTCYQYLHNNDNPCDGSHHTCPMVEVKRTGKPVVLEHHHVDENGQKIVEVHAYPIYDGQGKISHMIEYDLDITDRKRAQEEIEQLSRFPLENPNPVVRISYDGTIVFANKASEPLLEHWNCHFGEKISEECTKRSKSALDTGMPQRFELKVNDRTFSITFAPVQASNFVNVYGLDITELKEAMDEIEKLSKFPSENPNPVLRLSRDGTVVFHNKASQPLLKNSQNTNGEPLHETWSNLVIETLEDNMIKTMETEIEDNMILLTFAPISGTDFVNVYGLDITERKKAAKELKKYRNHLEDIIKDRTADFMRTNKALQNVIARRKIIESDLRENQEKYRAVVEQSGDAIFLLNRERNTIFEANDVFVKSLGYTLEEITDLTIYDILAHTKKEIDYLIQSITDSEHVYRGERRYRRKDGDLLDMDISAGIITHKKEPTLCFVLRDITSRKKTEENMRKQFMRYLVPEKDLYFILDHTPIRSLSVINDLENVGTPCYILSRTPENEIRKLQEGKYEFMWIAEKGNHRTIEPDLSKIEQYIESIPERSAILLECTNYLVTRHDFVKTLHFLQRLREIAYLKNSMIMISLDPTTLTDDQLAHIQNEAKEVKDRHSSKITGPHLEIMEYVMKKNQKGIKPTYGDIGKALSISKPTLGKRLHNLHSAGYIAIARKGNRKIVEMTRYGIDSVLKKEE